MLDLTTKIIRMWQQPRFEPGGKIVEQTIVQYMLGDHGPFQYTSDGPIERLALERHVADHRAILEAFK